MVFVLEAALLGQLLHRVGPARQQERRPLQPQPLQQRHGRQREVLLAEAYRKAQVLGLLEVVSEARDEHGVPVQAEVIDGPQSVVWDEAENRMHVQKALMEFLLLGRVKA